MLKEETKKCAELSGKMLKEMCSDGYSRKSVDHHVKPIYNTLVKYCDEHFEGMYSVKSGESFMMRLLPDMRINLFKPERLPPTQDTTHI